MEEALPWSFKWREIIEDAADSPGEASISLEKSCRQVELERRLASRTKWNLSSRQSEFSDALLSLGF